MHDNLARTPPTTFCAYVYPSYMAHQRKLPSYVYLPPTAARRQAETTRRGVFNLLTHEILWRDRYVFLLKEGYRLRPRYHPDWRPSWTGTNIDLEFCEDSVTQFYYILRT
ncbi:hypothetical protein FKP32DRAFT_1093104 [Trametes sanguinea]|nr:hypothetical protein FKP32DRAFT_1093104 [Trametes sanguinea]